MEYLVHIQFLSTNIHNEYLTNLYYYFNRLENNIKILKYIL